MRRRRIANSDSQPVTILVLALLTAAAWAAWLGWDGVRDVHPDGSTTGPYEAWQVIGLVATLLVPVYWAASRRNTTAAVLGTTLGLTVAAYCDWSGEASGLYLVGVVTVMLGSLAATAAVSAVIAAITPEPRH
uniref:Integral membrane protein n=1 Tax=Streptomyces sp. NBC_00049 TaxID=2903617 RepID=A0AAU2JS68_9ACTN